VSRIAVLIFVALWMVAMSSYPGWNAFDSHSVGHDVLRNFLCDLLAATTPDGRSNLVGSTAMNAGVVVLVLGALLPLWWQVPLRGPWRCTSRVLGVVAAIFSLTICVQQAFALAISHNTVTLSAAAAGLVPTTYTGKCVRELDGGGKEVWKFADLEDPYYAQRLPDGHTVISDAGHSRVIEVDRAGKVVWERTELKRPVAAVRIPDGHTLIVEQEGNVLELDEQNNVIWQAEVGTARAMRAERLNNGNTLIAEHVGNQVVELGPGAQEAAKPIEVQGAQAVLRRRDGHTLIAATTHWLELDATGKEVWRRKGQYAVGIFW